MVCASSLLTTSESNNKRHTVTYALSMLCSGAAQNLNRRSEHTSPERVTRFVCREVLPGNENGVHARILAHAIPRATMQWYLQAQANARKERMQLPSYIHTARSSPHEATPSHQR